MNEGYGEQLNAQQKAAIARIDGPTLLLAVPGSGKTTVILHRIAHMVQDLGIDLKCILTLTFSRASANDLKQRYAELYKSAEMPKFSTIHAFAFSVIRQYERRVRKKPCTLVEDSGRMLSGVYRSIYKSWPSENDLADLKSGITYVKNRMIEGEALKNYKAGEFDFYRLLKAYEAEKQAAGQMDFDDMLHYAYQYLRENPDLLARYQEVYHYINLDEAQDTSKLQFEILHLLAGKHKNIFMVGDEDQSIYGFRGAYPEELLRFKETYPQGQVLLMETNYRSTRGIVERANDFITLNADRYAKKMVTDKSEGMLPAHEWVASIEDQYRYILNSVRLEGKETAVLYRNNESVVPLADLFEREGVPYNLREHNPLFFTHYIPKDMERFFALAGDMTRIDLFDDIYYKISCNISRENYLRFKEAYTPGTNVFTALENFADFPQWLTEKIKERHKAFKQLPSQSTAEGLAFIHHHLGYKNYLDYRITAGGREDVLTAKLDALKALARREPDPESFFRHLAELKQKLTAPGEPVEGAVTFSTIHGSKGLEFDKVIVIDGVEGRFPPESALAETEESKQLYEEEVRLFYVGVTRAKRELIFLSVGKEGDNNTQYPVSSFICRLMGEEEKAKKRVTDIGQRTMEKNRQRNFASPLPKKCAKTSVKVVAGLTEGSVIEHKGFGRGCIISCNGEIALVNFDGCGEKKLNLRVCMANGLIKKKKC